MLQYMPAGALPARIDHCLHRTRLRAFSLKKAQRKSRRTPSPLSGRNNSQQKLPDSSATSCIFAYASFFSINDDKNLCNTFFFYFGCFLRFFEDTIQYFQAFEDSYHAHCPWRSFFAPAKPFVRWKMNTAGEKGLRHNKHGGADRETAEKHAGKAHCFFSRSLFWNILIGICIHCKIFYILPAKDSQLMDV